MELRVIVRVRSSHPASTLLSHSGYRDRTAGYDVSSRSPTFVR
jgi:hypothetical protein